jgi:aminoglycoside phosphotransferase (APT) family kinase protein
LRPSKPSKPQDVRRLLASAFPHEPVDGLTALEGGRSNATYRLRLGRFGDVVVRLYLGHRAAVVTELHAIERARDVIPVPEIVHADLDAASGPFIVYRYISGETFRDLKRRGDRAATARAAFAVGETLARLRSVRFDREMPFSADGVALWSIATGVEAWHRFLHACASSEIFVRRTGAAHARALRALADAWSSRLAWALDAQPVLVHGDFSRSNILLDKARPGRVAAFIDWERACAASQLFDVGHFLRYEDGAAPLLEPHFSNGFRAAGGALPDGWRQCARAVDAAALAGALTKPGLPRPAIREIGDLLAATLAVTM